MSVGVLTSVDVVSTEEKEEKIKQTKYVSMSAIASKLSVYVNTGDQYTSQIGTCNELQSVVCLSVSQVAIVTAVSISYDNYN